MQKFYIVMLERKSDKIEPLKIFGISDNFSQCLQYLKVIQYDLWKENIYQNWKVVEEDLEYSEDYEEWFVKYQNIATKEICEAKIQTIFKVRKLEECYKSINFNLDYVLRNEND